MSAEASQLVGPVTVRSTDVQKQCRIQYCTTSFGYCEPDFLTDSYSGLT